MKEKTKLSTESKEDKLVEKTEKFEEMDEEMPQSSPNNKLRNKLLIKKLKQNENKWKRRVLIILLLLLLLIGIGIYVIYSKEIQRRKNEFDNKILNHGLPESQQDSIQLGKGQEPDYVYVTKTGTKYHSNPNCGKSKTANRISLDEAKRMGYTPCKKCFR